MYEHELPEVLSELDGGTVIDSRKNASGCQCCEFGALVMVFDFGSKMHWYKIIGLNEGEITYRKSYQDFHKAARWYEDWLKP